MAKTLGDMLIERRRQMGLSIQQVSNIIKIRPQIIEFFETNNFAAMPQRGYAQGMISSYARFLGLNPREVVDAYFDGLYAYERMAQEAGGVSAGSTMMPAANVSARGSGAQGRYLMVEAGRPSSSGSRFAQRPSQAGYVSESRSSHNSLPVSHPQENARLNQTQATYRHTGKTQHSGMQGGAFHHTSALPQGQSTGEWPSMRDTQLHDHGRRGAYQGHYYGNNQGHIRGGQDARSRGARGNMQGQSRGRAQNARSMRGASRGRRQSGIAALLSDQRFIMGCLAIIVLLIVLVVFLLVRGCTGANAQTGGSSSGSSSTSALHLTDMGSSVTGSGTAASGATGSAATSAEAQPSQYTVKVSYTGDSTAWLEIKVGGQYDQDGGTVTEGFSKEYTVTDSIEISTNKPSDIEVTKDGERVSYDSKSSGIGRITITVPKSEDTSEDATEADDTTTEAAA